jgi:hypothetical protein
VLVKMVVLAVQAQLGLWQRCRVLVRLVKETMRGLITSIRPEQGTRQVVAAVLAQQVLPHQIQVVALVALVHLIQLAARQ